MAMHGHVDVWGMDLMGIRKWLYAWRVMKDEMGSKNMGIVVGMATSRWSVRCD